MTFYISHSGLQHLKASDNNFSVQVLKARNSPDISQKVVVMLEHKTLKKKKNTVSLQRLERNSAARGPDPDLQTFSSPTA